MDCMLQKIFVSNQGEVLVEKDTLLEKKATDAKGTLTFDSDLPHGKYYVKEEVRKAGYLPNEEVWNVDATYENQNLAKIELNKEVENQPTETRITKTDATTGNELEGAKLQVIDKDGTDRGRMDQYQRRTCDLWSAGRNLYLA